MFNPSKVFINYKKPFIASRLTLSLSVFYASLIPAFAVTPEQYQEQRNEALQDDILPNPTVNIDTNPYQTDLPASTETDSVEANSPSDNCFVIDDIYLVGDMAPTFDFALRPYTQGKASVLGSCMNVTDINGLVSQVQNRIIDKGYVTTRVVVHNQNLKAGDLYLTLIPGRIDGIMGKDVTASRSIYTDALGNPANFAPALPMQSGDLLNVRDIEQGLENLKRVPTARADFSIAPSTRISEPGYSDVLIDWSQNRRWRLSASVDDSGQKSTGVYQGSVTVSLDNPTWHNDLLYLSYSHSLDGLNDNQKKGSWGYNVGYTLPFNHTLLTLTHSGYNYDQTVAGANQDYVYSGDSYTTNAKVSQLVHRDNHSKTHLHASGFAKQQRNYIDDTEVDVQRRRTAGYRMGVSHDTSLGQTKVMTDVTYQRGTGAFDALTPPEALFNEGSARAGIIKLDMDVTRPFEWLGGAMNYQASLKGQYAMDSLVPNDRFAIGGRYTVRGFDGERSLSGDHGILLRQELSRYLGNQPHAVYLGIDAGYIGMEDAAKNDLLLGQYLVGGVVGIKGQIKPINVNYDIFTSHPIDQPEKFSDKDWVSGFSLSWQY